MQQNNSIHFAENRERGNLEGIIVYIICKSTNFHPHIPRSAIMKMFNKDINSSLRSKLKQEILCIHFVFTIVISNEKSEIKLNQPS